MTLGRIGRASNWQAPIKIYYRLKYWSRMLQAAHCRATVEPTVYKLQVAAVFWVAVLAAQALGVSSAIRLIGKSLNSGRTEPR